MRLNPAVRCSHRRAIWQRRSGEGRGLQPATGSPRQTANTFGKDLAMMVIKNPCECDELPLRTLRHIDAQEHSQGRKSFNL